MFILHLNDMRYPKIEMTNPVFRSESSEALLALLEAERVESYCDGKWQKFFRKDGCLEWYNPPYRELIEDIGTEEEWTQRAIDEYKQILADVPELKG